MHLFLYFFILTEIFILKVALLLFSGFKNILKIISLPYMQSTSHVRKSNWNVFNIKFIYILWVKLVIVLETDVLFRIFHIHSKHIQLSKKAAYFLPISLRNFKPCHSILCKSLAGLNLIPNLVLQERIKMM